MATDNHELFVTDSADISPERLSLLLARKIARVAILRTGETSKRAYAHIAADGDSFFVKWTRPQEYSKRKAHANRREVWFYQTLGDSDLPASRCFAALADDAGASTLILEDLSDIYTPWTTQTRNWEHQCVDALATLHARFWNDPRLEILARDTVESLDDWRSRMHGRVEGMSDDLGGRDISAIQKLIDSPAWQDYFARSQRHPLTIQHSDTHRFNFMYSEQGAVLVDWELVEIGVPTVDLAQFIVFNCLSRRDELVERYRGQTPYDMHQFENDWRMALCLCPLLVSAFWQNGMRGNRLHEAFDASLTAIRPAIQ